MGLFYWSNSFTNSRRNVDHRELGGWSRYIDGEDELADSGGTRGMFEFMEDSGAVRYMPEANAITAADVPTDQQIIKILGNHRRQGQ